MPPFLMSHKDEIIYRDGSFWKRSYEEQEVVLSENVIKSSVKPQAYMVRSAFCVGKTPCDIMAMKDDSIVVGVPVTFIPWKQAYMKTRDSYGYRVPCLNSRGFAGTVSDTEVLDLKVFDRRIPLADGSHVQPWLFIPMMSCTPSNVYCLLKYKGEMFLPPLVNIFTDGRMCMGPEWDNNRRNGMSDIAGVVTHAVHSWMSSIWNDHLKNPHCRRMTSVDEGGRFYYEMNPKEFANNLTPAAPAFLANWKFL